jgi:hypothetical protein
MGDELRSGNAYVEYVLKDAVRRGDRKTNPVSQTNQTMPIDHQKWLAYLGSIIEIIPVMVALAIRRKVSYTI